MKDEKFLPTDKIDRFFQIDTIILRYVSPGMPKWRKMTSFLFLCNTLRKKRVMKLIFCMQISIKVSYYNFWWGCSSIPKVPKTASVQCLYNILKNEIHLKLSYGMQINIKVTCNLISKLWTPKFSTRWYYHYWRPWSSILKVFISQSRVEFIFCMEINIKISTSCIALDGSGKVCLKLKK